MCPAIPLSKAITTESPIRNSAGPMDPFSLRTRAISYPPNTLFTNLKSRAVSLETIHEVTT